MKLKQKMIIRVPMNSDKCRSKALRIVSRVKGTIISVSIGGLNEDELVVTGERVDFVTLVQSLRKKFRLATVLSLQQFSDDEGSYHRRHDADYFPDHYHCYTWPRQYSPAAYNIECPPYPVYDVAQHAPERPSICSIM